MKTTQSYYGNYAIYQESYPKDMPWYKLTKGIYAFAMVGNSAPSPDSVESDWANYETEGVVPRKVGTYATGDYNPQSPKLYSTDPWSDFYNIFSGDYATATVDYHAKNTMKSFVDTAVEAGKKPILSIGGWSCSIHLLDAMKQSGGPQKVADAVYDFVTNTIPRATSADASSDPSKGANFRGVDIDLEPYANNWGKMSDAEKDAYVATMQAIRAKFPGDFEVSIAISGSHKTPEYLGAERIKKISDAVNTATIMTYDLHGSFEAPGKVNLHAPLYPYTVGGDVASQYSVNEAVKAYRAYGFDHAKLLVGIPAYGRPYKLTEPIDFSQSVEHYMGADFTSAGGTPLYSGTPKTSGQADIHGELADSIVRLRAIGQAAGAFQEELIEKSGSVLAVLTHGGNSYAVSYDNSVSVATKAQYVKEQGLGGITLWADNGDVGGELIGIAYDCFL
jgi:GH18 family chitinase